MTIKKTSVYKVGDRTFESHREALVHEATLQSEPSVDSYLAGADFNELTPRYKGTVKNQIMAWEKHRLSSTIEERVEQESEA